MTSAAARRFAALPTAAKLLLILTAALLPIGIGLVWVAENGIRDANLASREITEDQARTAARAIESLIARNALALRIAANGALSGGPAGACDRARSSLAVAPGINHQFELNRSDGTPLCAVGTPAAPPDSALVAPGDIRLRVALGGDALNLRVGVIGGMATTSLPAHEMRTAALEQNRGIESLVIRDRERQLRLVEAASGDGNS